MAGSPQVRPPGITLTHPPTNQHTSAPKFQRGTPFGCILLKKELNCRTPLVYYAQMSKINHVAIMGLGLMGGSLGLALRRQPGMRVSGYARREETRRLALACGAVDDVFLHPAEAVRGAQLTVICTPVGQIPAMAEACLAGLEPGSVVTDVGSSKAEVVRRMDAIFAGTQAVFVGSHPIAGSERQGLESASADLYRGALVVVTPSDLTDPAALRMAEEFWAGLGARVRRTAPGDHDRLLAATSHLPHLAAALVSATVGRHAPEQAGIFCGSGFYDTTRVAEGDPALWREILQTNRAAVLEELRALQNNLTALTAALEGGDFEAAQCLLADARVKRRALLAQGKDDQTDK